MYYLGVDGGGTKTRYILIDESFNKKVDVERGTIHIQQVGIETLKKEIKNTISDICLKAKISISEIENIFLAVPGYGESQDDKKAIDDAVKEVLQDSKYTVDNDCVAGWAAGTAGEEGINIVAGTGSIAFGMNNEGKTARCGGWGHAIGDDGGAHWIAVRVLNEYTKQKDGRKPVTPLVEILEREYKIDSYFGIVDIVYNDYKLARTEMAGFAKVASLAAEAGCPVCIKIFEEAAKELFLHVKALAKELEFKNEFVVSYTGGVFKAGELILKPMRELIEKEKLNCKLSAPKLDPWNGAALMAYKLSGQKVPENYEFS